MDLHLTAFAPSVMLREILFHVCHHHPVPPQLVHA